MKFRPIFAVAIALSLSSCSGNLKGLDIQTAGVGPGNAPAPDGGGADDGSGNGNEDDGPTDPNAREPGDPVATGDPLPPAPPVITPPFSPPSGSVPLTEFACPTPPPLGGWTAIPATTGVVLKVAKGATPTAGGFALALAASKLRKGYPDQLLLERGGTYQLPDPGTSPACPKGYTGTGYFQWSCYMGGKSPAEPMVIAAYGSGPRPIIVTNHGSALSFSGHDVLFKNLEFQPTAAVAGGPTGISLGESQNLVFENIVVRNFRNGMDIQVLSGVDNFKPNNIVVRKSQILDSFPQNTTPALTIKDFPAVPGRSQGIFAFNTMGLILESNLFDHVGWKSRNPADPQRATFENQAVYLHASTKCSVVRNNIFARASGFGLQARGGGLVDNNLFVQNPLAMSWGLVLGGSVDSQSIEMGVHGTVSNNVVLDTTDLLDDHPEIKASCPADTTAAPGNHNCWVGTKANGGISIANASSATVTNNILTRHLAGSNRGDGIILAGFMGLGIHNTVVDNNILYNLQNGLKLQGTGYGPVVLKPETQACPDGKTKTGADVFDLDGVKLINLCSTGILMKTTDSEVALGPPNVTIKNNQFQDITTTAIGIEGTADSWIANDLSKFTFSGNAYQSSTLPAKAGISFSSGSVNSAYSIDTWLTTTQEAPFNAAKAYDPTSAARGVETYLRDKVKDSTATLDEFILKAKAQDEGAWDANITADGVNTYVRAGFGR